MDIERELEMLIDKHKGKQVGLGEIRLDWFAEDCLKEIRRLKSAIARQSVKSEDNCKELREDFMHNLRGCDTVTVSLNGVGSTDYSTEDIYNMIASLTDNQVVAKSATSEEVAEAIEELMSGIWQSSKDGYPITLGGKTLDLAITALQAYESTSRKDRIVEEAQVEINRLKKVLNQTKEAAKELKEQKYTVNMLPVYNQIKSLELQITALQAYEPWIRVSERMPTEGEFVLCYCEKYGVIEASYQFEQWWLDDDSWTATGVTHWKSLPEPPKGETI